MKKPKASRTEAQESILRLMDQLTRNKVSFDAAQADLAGLLDRVTRNQEVTVITPRGGGHPGRRAQHPPDGGSPVLFLPQQRPAPL